MFIQGLIDRRYALWDFTPIKIFMIRNKFKLSIFPFFLNLWRYYKMLIKVISGIDKKIKKSVTANTLEELLLKGYIFIKYDIKKKI